MSEEHLIGKARYDFRQFIHGLSGPRARNAEVLGKDSPVVLYKQAFGVEAVNHFLKERPDLAKYRAQLVDSAKAKYSFDQEQWSKVLAR